MYRLAATSLALSLPLMGAAYAQYDGEPTSVDAPLGIAATSFGAALTPVFDVNGDGFPDFVLAAPDATNPADPQVGEGMVFLHLGSAKGPVPTPLSILDGDLPGIRFGAVVCGPGDVDGDGFADVMVCAPDYGNGEANEGRVSLYRGSPGGLISPPLWTFESNNDETKIGSILVPLGDLNGDGHADMGLSDVDVVLACAFYGGINGFSSVPDWIFAVNGLGQGGMSALGDMNGDGFDDIVVAGFDGAGSGTSKAYLFRGGVTGLEPFPAGAFVGAAGCSGMRLAPGGDLNADGRPDALIGDTCDKVLRTYLGNGKTLKSSAVVPQPFHSASFPVLLAGGHDADGDGFDDVATGDPGPGRLWLNRGRKNGVDPVSLQLASPPLGVFSNSFGVALAFAGDIDLDGDSELLVGDPEGDSANEPGVDFAGKVFVYSGSPVNASLGPYFRAGDRLEMILSPVETVNFDGVKGEKLGLGFEAPAGTKLEIDLLAPSGVLEASFDLKVGANPASLSMKLKASGRYAIVFGKKGDTSIALAVTTTETLPKKARARTEQVSLKKGKSLTSFDVLALPGATLDLSLTPASPLLSLLPGLAFPSATNFPMTPYQSGDASGLGIAGLPLFSPGKYRISALAEAAAKTKLTIEITPVQPPVGTATIVVP